MKEDFDERRLLSRLAYPTGISRGTPGHRRLRVYCQGDEHQLAGLLEDTPFVLADSRFAIECLDYRGSYWTKGEVRLPFQGYLSCHVTVRVRYGDYVGGYWLHSFSNDWRNVMGNREYLGDPKELGDISLVNSAGRIDLSIRHATDGRAGAMALAYGADFSEPDVAEVDDFDLSQYLTIRAVPSLTGPSAFELVEIVGIDLDGPFNETARHTGRGSVAVASTGSVAGLKVVDVLGATLTEGELAYTAGKSPYTILHRSRG